MSDGFDSAPAKARLDYPFASPPDRGHTLEVATGVHWIRMPLPMALNHINLWALDDGEGWALVDTGMRTDEATAVWGELFAQAPDQRTLTRVIVTHMHPDHIGLAGWLTRKFGVRLWMTPLEYLSCRSLVADTGREAPEDGVRFFRHAGWSEAALEHYRARFGNFGRHIHSLPDSFVRLREGQPLTIGQHQWHVIIGRGHSPEHACLYCPEQKLLISGDQVLPRISSNVSVYPTEPDANPMVDWLDSLDKLQRLVPDDVLVLPAHGECFRGLHARINALRRGQEVALTRLRRTLAEPRRVVDVFTALFGRNITEADGPVLSMATGEGRACLNLLLHRGEAVCETDAHGVGWYRLVNTPHTAAQA